jgi:hypothetical protein
MSNRKKKHRIVFGVMNLLTLFLLSQSVNAEYITSGVTQIGSGWDDNSSCVYLASGDVVKVNLNTPKGKAELSIAMLAEATRKELRIYYYEDRDLQGGCNTGTTVREYGILQMR